jgi:hypothetical protein
VESGLPMSVREELERRLVVIQGVVRRPARRGRGHSYFVGEQEIAHFHGEERMDVRLTRERIQQRLAEGGFDPRVRTRGPSADWVAVRVVEAPDLPLALSLAAEAVATLVNASDEAQSRRSR